ncbi:Pantothenate synthetase [Sedimentisphaera cyanobacteriorum]|uniref:Pantothenate synthetase n=1 Tax=Sedimentisphaera cyanobacteriorum TaxID=1940790 RepID=A0A1Q2HP41_9BACT|nr:pantoate--beta-alanine ligase [Sedimentisphaera cyanobacteriorum]AQQ09229.1 Pantothenate synthetase [Sedimentisphaera cyanobacteriorum]
MKKAETKSEIRRIVSSVKADGKSVGLVPTMGALHEGHLSLIERASSDCDFVVVSVFVNPTQFGPNEDLESYPRNLSEDLKRSEKAGADAVFAPSAGQMYPEPQKVWVDVEGPLTETLCGAARPGHFRGVATVCTKLFNIVQPDRAYFGQKDAQQLAVIRAAAAQLDMPLEIIGCPIVREESGLAMSSRNDYLSEDQRKQAGVLYKSLMLCRELFNSGQRDTSRLKSKIRETIQSCPSAEIDYIEIVRKDTFQPEENISAESLAAIAVRIGPARLIDNITLKP